MIARLTAAQRALQDDLKTTSERAGLARAERDQAAREVLSREPLGAIGHPGIPPAIVLGAISGLVLSLWWFGSEFSLTWPRLAAGLAISTSSVVLLRGAWHSGRVNGARGPR